MEQSLGLSLAEAGEMYLRLKGSNRPKTFHSAVERALGYVVKVIGNKPLLAISRKDAAAVRDDLVAKGLGSMLITMRMQMDPGCLVALFNMQRKAPLSAMRLILALPRPREMALV